MWKEEIYYAYFKDCGHLLIESYYTLEPKRAIEMAGDHYGGTYDSKGRCYVCSGPAVTQKRTRIADDVIVKID